MSPWLVYIAAASCEISGCFCFWAWQRNGQSSALLVPGVLLLALFAWLLTRVDSAFAGRSYAAYGGIYIATSLAWLWLAEGQRPSATDLAGSTLSLIGAIVIMAGFARPLSS